jgi:hypothetical protein
MVTGNGSMRGVGKSLSTMTDDEQPTSRTLAATAGQQRKEHWERTIGMCLILSPEAGVAWWIQRYHRTGPFKRGAPAATGAYDRGRRARFRWS